MNSAQKKVTAGLVILCAVLVLGACAPEPDSTAPTMSIIILNVPANVIRTGGTPGSAPLYKVYVQLSAGMTASAGYAALGDAKDGNLTLQSNGTYMATINNLKGPGWLGTNWANQCVIICPDTVDDIYDIDAKVGMTGPTTSSIVVFDWKALMSKQKMDMSPDKKGVENYKQLYGKAGMKDGVVVTDSDIGGSKARADSSINSFGQFSNPND